MDFLRPAKYFFIASTIATFVSIGLVFYPGPRVSIEFTGGTRMELEMLSSAAVTTQQVQASVESFKDMPLTATVNKAQNGHFIIRTKNLDAQTHTQLIAHLSADLKGVREAQYTTIGPTVGSTLKQRAAIALLVASLGIIVYLAFAFRGIPRRYSPWKFGIVAVVTLLHDVMVTVGIFIVLSRFTVFEVDTLFVTALLTILGYSVNDTIIIFDRIRDNLFTMEHKEEFAVVANRSVNQGVKRSLLTSVATLIMLTCMFFLGSASIQWFVLALIIGIILGTYSSIFVATPLLVYWIEPRKRR